MVYEIGRTKSGLRMGFTTGSCAAAAAKAATYMLLSGETIQQVKLMTPKGIELYLDVEKIRQTEKFVECAIRKYSGDDPDVTNGLLVFARVKKERQTTDTAFYEGNLSLEGGVGVGRITHPGLEQKVGQAAINQIPRKMIFDAVQEICLQKEYQGELSVEISIPEGVDAAKKTFHPRLGIRGGISVLGTSGIVEPMSEQALIDTIRTEIKMHIAEGEKVLLIAPGNYGQDFLLNTLGIELKRSIKCSNYIGDTIDMVCDAGAEAMLLVGHIGKLVKLGAGIMNTHSKAADGRMEVLAACAIRAGAEADTARKILDCVTTEAALDILKKSDMLENTMKQLMIRIEDVLQRRSSGKIRIGAIVFSNEYGILGKTKTADMLLEDIMENNYG